VASLGAGTVADVTEIKRRICNVNIPPRPSMWTNSWTVSEVFLLDRLLGGGFLDFWVGRFKENEEIKTNASKAISSFALWLYIIFFLPGTLRSRVANGATYAGKSLFIFPPYIIAKQTEEAKLAPKLPKPSPMVFWRLFIYPPIGIVSFNTAVVFSNYYCVAVNQPYELSSRYGWSTTGVGLSYLASGIDISLYFEW
jgi:hypothetical protein